MDAEWERDSDLIFTAVSTSGAKSFEEAKRMVVVLYIPDLTFSRNGISHALKRLEQFWRDKPTYKVVAEQPAAPDSNF